MNGRKGTPLQLCCSRRQTFWVGKEEDLRARLPPSTFTADECVLCLEAEADDPHNVCTDPMTEDDTVNQGEGSYAKGCSH